MNNTPQHSWPFFFFCIYIIVSLIPFGK
jgi:hypothetical protein